jgi:hypothetical protein
MCAFNLLTTYNMRQLSPSHYLFLPDNLLIEKIAGYFVVKVAVVL